MQRGASSEGYGNLADAYNAASHAHQQRDDQGLGSRGGSDNQRGRGRSPKCGRSPARSA